MDGHRQVRDIEDQKTKQLRAYVAAEPGSKPVIVSGLSFLAEVHVINTGTTPAIDVIADGTVHIVDKSDIATSVDDFASEFRHETHQGSIFPSRDRYLHVGTTLPIGQTEIDQLDKGQILLVFGVLFYRDQVTSFVRHTEFCWYYDYTGSNVAGATYCEEHNDAD